MDIKVIAGYIGTDPHTFMAEYCRQSGGKPILTQSSNGYCIFWDKLCRIHPVKPRMCREWPFIESVLVDAKNWHAMAGSCPGMRTDVVDDTIRACVREERGK
jgi:Fe-S-cluster containining protein